MSAQETPRGSDQVANGVQTPLSQATQRRIRQAALLVVLGLLVEVLTLTSARAVTFISFILVSGSLMGAGALWYLWGAWRDRRGRAASGRA